MEQWWNERFINRRDYLLDHFEQLSLSCEECMMILLIDFMNQHHIAISHGILATKMKMDEAQIDELLSRLTQKGYLQITYQDKKVVFLIDGIFDTPKENSMNFDQSLFDIFESEFARPLSQLELQRLSDWSHTYEQKLIMYALREALIYGKHSFDYIDRILTEWKRRGFHAQDYEDGKR